MPVPKAKEEGKQTSLKSRLQEYANKRKVIDEEAKQIVQPQQQVEEVKQKPKKTKKEKKAPVEEIDDMDLLDMLISDNKKCTLISCPTSIELFHW